jgi:MFS family permease
MRSSTSITFPVIATEFEWTLSIVGLQLASFLFTYGFANWFAVFLKENVKWIVCAGMGLSAFSFAAIPLLSGVVPNGYGVLICRLAAGLFEGVLYPAVAQMIVRYAAVTETAFVISIVFGGPNFANIIGFFLSPSILEAWGWQAVFFCYAAFIWFWLAVFAVVGTDDPAQLGHGRFSAKWAQMNEAELAGLPPRRRATGGVPWKLIFRRSELYALLYTHGTCNVAFYLILSWLPAYMTQVLGVSLSASGGLSSLPFLCNIFFSAFFWQIERFPALKAEVARCCRAQNVSDDCTPGAWLCVADNWSGADKRCRHDFLDVRGRVGDRRVLERLRRQLPRSVRAARSASVCNQQRDRAVFWPDCNFHRRPARRAVWLVGAVLFCVCRKLRWSGRVSGLWQSRSCHPGCGRGSDGVAGQHGRKRRR